MAIPILGIAAGIAARAVAKKTASRAVGGIVGKGAKSVNPVYKNTGSTIKVNSNPNKTPAKGQRNPTKTKWNKEEAMDPVYDKYGYPPKNTIKINTNPKRSK